MPAEDCLSVAYLNEVVFRGCIHNTFLSLPSALVMEMKQIVESGEVVAPVIRAKAGNFARLHR